MGGYYLGADLGATKTHVLVTTDEGLAIGFGQGGAGNHEVVGFDGFEQTLKQATRQALQSAGISADQILGAGFGVAGYDWPCEYAPILAVINQLGINAPKEVVNDTVPGICAAASDGWGIAVVAGTGCNCWGWDRSHTRIGHVTGGSLYFGEGGGASEMVLKSIQHVAYEYTRRGPATLLSQMYMELTGTHSLEELLSGLMLNQVKLEASAAPLIFQAADQGDLVALQVIDWAGTELGELVCAVARQLDFKDLAFDVVMLGSAFNGGPRLIDPMRMKIHTCVPHARLVRLNQPPVIGAVLMGMEKAGQKIDQAVRENLINSVGRLIK